MDTDEIIDLFSYAAYDSIEMDLYQRNPENRQHPDIAREERQRDRSYTRQESHDLSR